LRLPATPRPKTPVFPVLGAWIGWAAVLLGCLLIVGGIVLTVNINSGGGGFKPAGLIVFVLPGLLWTLFGGLLLGLRRRFVYPFWIFLVFNLLAGVLLTTQAGSLGGRGDARILAMIGIGFILGAIFFRLFVPWLPHARCSSLGRGDDKGNNVRLTAAMLTGPRWPFSWRFIQTYRGEAFAFLGSVWDLRPTDFRKLLGVNPKPAFRK
jgi:hypothetical protein